MRMDLKQTLVIVDLVMYLAEAPGTLSKEQAVEWLSRPVRSKLCLIPV